ncbi:MAG: zincin-like metallopeptidase domain-containing protein [Pseudomonadota bacterium]
MNADKKPFHETVAEKLIEHLRKGTAPWQKPWKPGDSGANMPINPTTGKRYKGINALHLMSEGREDQRWMTFKQAAAVDAQVRKGEKGTPIQYWKFTEEQIKTDAAGKPILDASGKPVQESVKLERPRVFFATVFNAEQIDGLPLPKPRIEQTWNAIERAEQILKTSGAVFRNGEHDRAFYRPATDSIHLPEKRQFPSADSFYATALHELGHWTGHESRLGRDLAHPFGSEGYAKEELRAEIASMILGDELGIGHDPEQHAAYVKSWIKALEDDPLEIFRAAADAEKIHAYVLGLEQKQVQAHEATNTQAASEHPVAFIDTNGLLRDWTSADQMPANWQGVVKHEGAYWYVGQEAGQRSFTVLSAMTLQDANTEAALHQAFGADKAKQLNLPQQRQAMEADMNVTQQEKAKRPDPEAWIVDRVKQGDFSRTVNAASFLQLKRMEDVLFEMLPPAASNPFWQRHELPQDVDALQDDIDEYREQVLLRQCDAPVAEARFGQHASKSLGREGRAGDAENFDEISYEALGFELPKDWNGRVSVQSSIPRDKEGQLIVRPVPIQGAEPEFWNVYVEHDDGHHTLVSKEEDKEEADELAERLKLIDAHSTINVHEKAAKLALINEERVRRDPNSTEEDITAAKEARKRAEVAATINDEDLQRRIQFAESELAQLAATQQNATRNESKKTNVLIDVPFKQKDEAKALGAKWDRKEQSWFVPSGVDAAPFSKWLQKGSKTAAVEVRTIPAPTGGEPAPKRTEGRQYLAVPYSERAAAKAAGAEWDKTAKSWYAGAKADKTKLAQWEPESFQLQQGPAMTPGEEFTEALKSVGCLVSGEHPIMDGKKHRISVEGEKFTQNSRSGFYVGHLDGHPAGYVKNNKTGVELTWKSKGYTLDPEQKALMAAEAARKLQKRDAELSKLQDQAAMRVVKQMEKLIPVKQPTPYMQAKGIEPHAGAFTDKDGMKLYLPATDANGKQWTMQYIQEDGTKRFAIESRKEGCFHVVGGMDELAKAPALVIGEGYATAASLKQSLGYATVSAFDAGNLATVAQALHQKFPDKPIVIAGDDDRHLELAQGVNPGRAKAEEAAKLVGGRVLLPIFAPGENSYPAHLDPVTPSKFRKHQQTDIELNDLQLDALSRMKQFTDFNDLANKSALGKEGIDRQVRSLVVDLIEKYELACAERQSRTVVKIRPISRSASQ